MILALVLTMPGHSSAESPSVVVRPAPEIRLRETDCNSPAHWDGDTLYIFNSVGQPYRSHGPDLHRLDTTGLPVKYDNEVSGARWIESTWRDRDGALYGWYHNEPVGVVPEVTDRFLTAPRIGAVVSRDNGATWKDLGFVLEERPETLRRDTRNFYFAGGNGDFCVVADRAGRYFYFFISTYGHPEEQGVAVARMESSRRGSPMGQVRKWRDGEWTEPGIGGKVTPIFPAFTDWHRPDANAFWGPSVHWNTHLRCWVMLLNRACDKDWTQEGIYISFNPEIANPRGWTTPVKILEPPYRPGWYPQVLGTAKGETDKLAGKKARLFLHGASHWEIEFVRPGEGR